MGVAGLTDSHCHLNHAQFDNDKSAVIDRARDAGIARLLVIGYDLASSRASLEIAQQFHGIQASVGIHPDSVSDWTDDSRTTLTAMVELNRRSIVAWGEIGLDYYYSDGAPRNLQAQVFEEQIECARGLDLPLVIHCRDAYGDVLATLDRMSYSRGVLHCFTGSRSDAVRAIDAGLYIGVGGILTFKRSDELRETIAALPLDRLLIETDCPYLAPQPWRGKRNEPAYLVAVAELLAGQRKKSPVEIAAATSANAEALFGRMEQENLVNRQ